MEQGLKVFRIIYVSIVLLDPIVLNVPAIVSNVDELARARLTVSIGKIGG